MKRFLKLTLVVLLVLFAAGGAGFVVWANAAAPASPAALTAGQSDALVTVELVNGWQVFRPAGRQPTTGLIFYPGGRVDFRAYAPLLRPLAEQGYLVVVPQMPLNLAVFGIQSAGKIMEAYTEVEQWALGGHSLGGSMAANFARANPEKVSGLVLWASYPAGSDNLAETTLKVLSISASEDGLATPEKIEASQPLLPPGADWVVIEGGNHAQFGSYGPQDGDGSPEIPAAIQWRQVITATVNLLQQLEN